MIKRVACLVLASYGLCSPWSASHHYQTKLSGTKLKFSPIALPLEFEPNLGQAPSDVKYIARLGHITVRLLPGAVMFTFPRPKHAQHQAIPEYGPKKVNSDVAFPSDRYEEDAVTDTLLMRIIGANRSAVIEGLEQSRASNNYFFGKDPTTWKLGIPTFLAVRYRGVYPGVDLVLRSSVGGKLEYDWIVAAGADPAMIECRFEGIQDLKMDSEGNLNVRTSSALLQHRAPVIFQETDGVRHLVAGRFETSSDDRVHFVLGNYSKDRTLVIDPVLSFSTYLGESNNLIIAADKVGNVYTAQTAQNFGVSSGVMKSTQIRVR